MRFSLLWIAVLAALGVVSSATPAHGGTICGSVRDAGTGQPVANAGVFVRLLSGAYTGLHGATDAMGGFCIAAVPDGTYDLEVLVDDYRIAYLRGVEVTGTTDVTVPAVTPPIFLAPPWPNPASGEIHFRWVLPRAAVTRLLVFDSGGRLVKGWSSRQPAGTHQLSWDLRDSRGRRILPGCYFVRFEADGARCSRAFRCRF